MLILTTMEATELTEVAGLLKALGEVNRLSLVCRLCDCTTPMWGTMECAETADEQLFYGDLTR